jgi:protein O-mannosyl-transferase
MVESQMIDRNAVPKPALIGLYLFLAAITWAVFGQTLGHQFVNYDDQNYVYENPEIVSGITAHGFFAAFAHLHARNWHPLTTLSHMVDCQVFGLNPAGHHLINVLLHTAAVLLLFSTLRAMTGALWRSAFVAAVFAIHPLRVESVAWVAERKDVLSGVFFMLTLGAYVRYARGPTLKGYLAMILFFGLALLSKPMVVTLPLLLLLLDYWPLARFEYLGRPNDTTVAPANPRFPTGRLILEKTPLLLLSILSGIVTLIAQRQTVEYSQHLALAGRLGNALVSYAAYIGQMFWPARLAVFYPQTADRVAVSEVLLAASLVAGITVVAFALRKTRPYLVVGWCWYLVCLLPVIGIVQVGLQGRADRYTYLAQIGLYVAITWTVTGLWAWTDQRRLLLPIAATFVVGALAWRAWIQTSSWRDTESLWNHAVAVTDDNDVAHNNVAGLLMRRGRLDDAIFHYEKALAIQDHNRETRYHLSAALLHNNLGNAFARKGLLDRAIEHYRKAAELRDDYTDAHANLAAMFAKKGQLEDAIVQYRKVLAVPPEEATAHLHLAGLLLRAGHANEAIAQSRRAVEMSGGNDPIILRILAASYAATGRFQEAVDASQRGLQLATEPGLAQALEQEIGRYKAGAAHIALHEENESAAKH